MRPNKQQITGYEMSFRLLCRALEMAGMRLHINNYGLARSNPAYPVGVSGFPIVLDRWSLPNPAVLGPGLYDHPKRNPGLMRDARFKVYFVKGDWMCHMFAPYYGADRVHPIFSGIDLREWPDTKGTKKDLDFLIYDKIRWHRDVYDRDLVRPILEELRRRDLRFDVLRYGQYTFAQYRPLLAKSSGMIFLCEHETQGHAWQEALASNVPVLAWDQGFWLDPMRPAFEAEPVPATSVPGFSAECGERFINAGDFPAKLELFMDRRELYAPRKWVADERSLELSAKLYLEQYWAAARLQ
jgi:hypothetical protein